MSTIIVHVNDGFEVYIGRRNNRRRLPESVFANPYTIGVDGTREDCIEKYRAYLLRSPWILERVPELRGKVLGCWCKPAACHGDVLAELADSPLPLARRCICGCLGAEHRVVWDGDTFIGTRCEEHGGHKFAMEPRP